MTRVSIIGPVLNEAQFIGFSIMSMLEHAHEFVYALDAKSSDGTRELLQYIKEKYAHEKLVILEHPTFHPLEMDKYNEAFNRCIRESSGDAIAFIHPDMICTKWADPKEGPLAWWTNVTSYAKDLKTVITKGRCDKWKNIHAKRFGVHYAGAYGSQNEDFYHSAITGKAYKHYGTDFAKYPFEVTDSGIDLAHYCELKPYKRRLEKMKLCLKTQTGSKDEAFIDDLATNHPRVTLEQSSNRFGQFEFTESANPIPEVFTKYEQEFSQFKKEPVCA